MPAHAWRLRHPRQLFQMLCLRSSHRLHRDEAIEALWPQSDAQASANRLYHTIHVLRAEFAKMGLDEREPVLLFQAGSVWLNPHHTLTLDVDELGALVSACTRADDGEATGARLERAAALCEVPLCGGLPQEPWFEPYRKEIHGHCVWVLERLAACRLDGGRADDAARALQKLVALEPSNEVAHRALMQLFDTADQPERAVLQYLACKRFLRRDLSVEPAPETEALHAAIMARSSNRALPAVAATPPQARYRAPALERAKVLGREAELTALTQQLADPGCRLITIAAPAGTGKTSVALALADAVQQHFREGALVVRLTQLADAAGLERFVCNATGVQCGTNDPAHTLHSHLADKQMLLVLDRFEHLVDAAPRIAALLATAPGVKLLVTSQCVLNCQAEHVFDLRQLADASPPAALALFIETARTAGAAPEQLADTERIADACARLGGNALAIQLAAAQLGAHAGGAFWGAADFRHEPHRDRQLDTEPQHRSLRAAIGWSISLLDEPTRAVLFGLTVFEASFGIEDAQAVLSAVFGAVPTRTALQALLERHLLGRDAAPAGAARGACFVLLDSIRRLLLDRLGDCEQWSAVEAAHACVFRERAREALRLLRTGQVPQALAVFEPAEPDIVRALGWQWAQGDAAAYLQACHEACTLQMQRGGIVEVGPRLRHAVALPAHSPQERRHSAWCCYLLSRQLDYCSDTPGSVLALRRGRQRARDIDDDLLHDRIGTQLGSIRATQLRLRAALMHLDEVIRVSERSNDTQRVAKALMVRGGLLGLRGGFETALASAQAGFDAALIANDPQLAWWAQMVMADLALRAGRLERAQAHVEECKTMERLGFFRGVPLLSLKLLYACLHFELEDHAQADACLRAAREDGIAAQSPRALAIDICADFIRIETGRSAEVVILLSLNDAIFPPCAEFGEIYVQLHSYRLRLLAQRGDSVSAQGSLASVLLPVRRSLNPLWASWVASALAGVAADRGEAAVALSLLQQAEGLQRDAGIVPSPRQTSSWGRLRQLVAARAGGLEAPGESAAAPSSFAAMVDAWQGLADTVLFAREARRGRNARPSRVRERVAAR
jgi:DNA-binding SARP family transcriptional activator/predicted ATPase